LSDQAESQGGPPEDIERWIMAGFSAASFAGLLQLSTLSPSPAFGTPQWAAALCFSIVVGLYFALVVKGKLIRKVLPAQWLRRVSTCLDVLVATSGLGIGAGSAMVATHLLHPHGGKLSWPTWFFVAGLVAIVIGVGVLVWAEKTEANARCSGPRQHSLGYNEYKYLGPVDADFYSSRSSRRTTTRPARE
jgi:hypothetical protein